MTVANGTNKRTSGAPWLLLAVLWLVPRPPGAATPLDTIVDENTQAAVELMLGFAERTGLSGSRAPRRYLWTDAFAVCNFLGLARATGDERHTVLALRLVEQVHGTLGRHRPDDPRSGWISGLGEAEGQAHPTRRGLRIGKPLPERAPGEPFDERLEWDRDGQYFHYLTKWMHALDQVTRSTGRSEFNVWARELAEAAHAAFTYLEPGRDRPRMYWKISIDASRPLVASMGQHDPLDGYVTYHQLEATAAGRDGAAPGPALAAQAAALAAMIPHESLATADPLGIGGLLTDAGRVEQLIRDGAPIADDLLEVLLGAALAGLTHYARAGVDREPATRRLAFRELGLAIGLHAVSLMAQGVAARPEPRPDPAVHARLQALLRHVPLATATEDFWRDPARQDNPTWMEHRDINEVMLATSLAPEGCLLLRDPGPAPGRRE